MRLSRKVELQPTPTQRQSFLQHSGNARWAYNWGLAQHKAAHEKWAALDRPKKWDGWPNSTSLSRDLNALKKIDIADGGVPWMYEASKCAPQGALRDLDRALGHFLAGRTGYPKFKSKSRSIGGFGFTGSISITDKTIRLPKIGRVRIKPGSHGYLPVGKHASASVTEKAGRWFVSIIMPEMEEAAANDGPIVGLDLGVARLVTLSDGTVVENPRALASGQKKIKRLQKDMSRKKKGSSNRKKAKAKLARAYARVSNLRRDALHKATTTIAKSHGKVVIEDLKVQNMTSRAHGKGRAAKAGLNRVIRDASFGEFRRQLEYKGKLYGCEVVAVPPQYTSQTCSSCGCVDASSRRSQSEFACVHCGFEINADLNAAINIKVAGSCPETQNACGAGVSHPAVQPAVKQELAVA